jgi:hypothetical protein
VYSGIPSLEHDKDNGPAYTQAAFFPPGKTLDKLDLPGAAKAGPGPPSPRGPGPGAPQQQNSQFQEKPFANHVGGHSAPNNNVIPTTSMPSRQLGGVPNQTGAPRNNNISNNNNHTAAAAQPAKAAAPAPMKTAAPAPAPSPKPPAPAPQSRAAPAKSFSPPPPAVASEPPPNARLPPNNNSNKSDMSSQRVSKIGGVAPILAPPPPRMDPQVPSFPDPAVLRQPHTLQINEPPPTHRGRTPTRQERNNNNNTRLAAAISDFGGGASNSDLGGPMPPPSSSQPGGGYNFQKIMDDRFEHYKRPPSRERSADRFGGLGSRQGSRQQLAGAAGAASRDISRDRSNVRPQSRQRTPLQGSTNSGGGGFSESKPLDSLNLDAGASSAVTGNGSAVGGVADLRLPAEDQLRYRGVQQEIPHFGAPPKRTESLYMKPGLDTQQPLYKVRWKIIYFKNRFVDIKNLHESSSS